MRISEIPHVDHGRIAVCGCQTSFRIDDSTVVEEYSLPDLPPPESIGRYRIVRYVGRGAVNCVYEAVHPDLGVRVAIKTLHPEYAGDRLSREQFARAAKVYAKAVHPNIVKVFETGKSADGVPFLAMEFLPGGSLADKLLGGKVFSPREAVEIGAEICRALTVTAGLGIVHRDIKPDNIMLAEDGRCRLTDLGLAKFDASPDTGNGACVLAENESVKPKRKTGFGTLEYMSPEQHLDAESCDIRSDIYSLGVTMYQLAAGRLPFETQTRTELRHMHLTVEPLVPSAYKPDIPIDFDYIVLHCIQKRPEDRYQTPDELLADLEAFLAGAPLPSTTGGAVPLDQTRFTGPAPTKAGLRRSWLLPALAALLVLLILAAAAILLRERSGAGRKTSHTQMPEERALDFSAVNDEVKPDLFPVDSLAEREADPSQTAQNELDLNRILPGDAQDVTAPEEQETDPEIIELFEKEKAGALQAIEKKSGFKSAIEDLNDLKASLTGPYLEEAEELIGKLEEEKEAAVRKFMKEFAPDADFLVDIGKLDEAVALYNTAMRVQAPAQEIKDAIRERIAEIVGQYMEPFDREARPMIRDHEFEKAVSVFVRLRDEMNYTNEMNDMSFAQEFPDACSARIAEIRRFRDEAVSAFDLAMEKRSQSGFDEAVKKLNSFRSSPVCAEEADRLIGGLEEAKKNASNVSPVPDSSESAEEGDLQE